MSPIKLKILKKIITINNKKIPKIIIITTKIILKSKIKKIKMNKNPNLPKNQIVIKIMNQKEITVTCKHPIQTIMETKTIIIILNLNKIKQI